MRPENSTVRKSVIAVTAVAALAGAGIAAPQIVAAAGNGTPTGRSVVDRADEQVLQARGLARQRGDDDRASGRHSGLDSPRDRAERKTANGRHLEPGDDDEVEPGDDDGNEVEPGDDDGNEVEPGDDDGNQGDHAEPGEDD